MPPPPAATITIRDTLAMLDGPKAELAEGVANDRYVFWLGSGISRERMPDLKGLVKTLMLGLQARVEVGNPACRFRKTLGDVVALAKPGDEERKGIDLDRKPDEWPVLDIIAERLVNDYARVLNVTVDLEEDDYLLWDMLGAAQLYADPAVEPDAEHLCLAALALEGVASEMPTANWDPLIERAFALLAGDQPVLRLVVTADDARSGRRRANLYKFHGCAKAACDNEAVYRPLLVARSSQIHGWIANNAVLAGMLVQLIVTRPTLMLGLSVQDANVQSLFAEAEAKMSWDWPSHPPAYAFAEDQLGGDQGALLQNVYRKVITAANRPQIREEALVRAYAKPLLLALYLHVVTAKLKRLVELRAPAFADADRDKLHRGLLAARNLVADGLAPDAASVADLLQLVGRGLAMLRDGALPQPANGVYSPVTIEPLDRMPADAGLPGSGLCEFAVASALIGLGLDRGLWTADKPNPVDPASGALILIGRSGSAKIYFAASARAAIRLHTNGLIADNDDAVIVHSHENPPPLPRSPRRPPGRTGLAILREVSIEDLLAAGSEADDLLARFRSKVAL